MVHGPGALTQHDMCAATLLQGRSLGLGGACYDEVVWYGRFPITGGFVSGSLQQAIYFASRMSCGELHEPTFVFWLLLQTVLEDVEPNHSPDKARRNKPRVKRPKSDDFACVLFWLPHSPVFPSAFRQ